MDIAIFAPICSGVTQSYTIIPVFVEERRACACVCVRACVWGVHTHIIRKSGSKPIRYHMTTERAKGAGKK